mgnify:CR=1 FL=1
MLRKFKDACKRAVEDFMVSCDMCTTDLDDLEKTAKYGAASFTILIVIAAIALAFGLSIIATIIVLYDIFNGIVIAFGIDELVYAIPDEIENRIEESDREKLNLRKIQTSHQVPDFLRRVKNPSNDVAIYVNLG